MRRSTQRIRASTRALARVAFAAISAASLLNPSGVRALVIEREDESISQRAPEDDPGWANVGVCDGWTAVYLGDRWVLTAAHVGASPIELDGVVYAADRSSRVVVENPDGTPTDLMLFQITSEPDLPHLAIARESPPIGSVVLLVGAGLGGSEPMRGSGRAGFRWNAPARKRWGTSTVHEYVHDHSVGNTDVFATRFSIAKTAHEAQAAHGDSGGAAFVRLGREWQLSGIMLAVDGHPGQPQRSAIYGNRTFIADLARYRAFVLRVIGAEQG
ncbi:MAG TPA: trypsin-like peptidase domain-containing protein [Myxococcota bacterium]|nr:trypsin-like peptidase domain-containing protein [Myxococcota bacterium]